MIRHITASPVASASERRFLNRLRCHIPTFVQGAAEKDCVLYRAVIRDWSVSGLGLYTSGPLSLGPATVELPTRLYQPLSLTCIQICNVAQVVSGMWRIGAQFSEPLHYPVISDLMVCDQEGREAP
jgi:hypothetical protein